MKLTTRGLYALKAMLELAKQTGGPTQKPVPLKVLADAQKLSLAYLAQLFMQLKHRGLVLSARGPRGGYQLSKPADQISIAEVLKAVSENVDVTACQGAKNCRNGSKCDTHHLWTQMNQRIEGLLEETTLLSLSRQDEELDLESVESVVFDA